MTMKNFVQLWISISILTFSAASNAQGTPPPAPQPTVVAPTPEPTAKVDTTSNDEPKPNDKVTPLDKSVAPSKADEIPGVFKNMVVVQRKAKKKANKWLFSPYATLDFSDGPITAYALNTDIGYAISDFWEVYLNAVPYFMTIERPIVQKVKDLGPLANGQLPEITYAKPTSQLGVNVLWLPAYGKESWGAHSIVRSDTFLKMGLSEIMYASHDSGLRAVAQVGKTYYLGNYWNIRVAAGVAYEESIVDGEKNYNWVPVLESGLVYYF
jgi:hypothetical protein